MRPLTFSISLFTLSLVLYLAAIPYLLETWAITGDEPHYLLAAHSLAFDGDLDLANNYAQRDYQAFYPSGVLDPHVKVQPNGTQLLSHDLGLPVLIAPAYALSGREGVMRFFAVVGAVLAVQMFLLGWEVSGRWWAGALAWLAMSFSAPLALYVFQIYPEMLGGFLTLWAMRQILGTPSWIKEEGRRKEEEGRRFSFFLLPPSLMLLPWLSGRYAPILLFLVALTIWKHWPQRKVWLTTSGFALASLTIYLIANYVFYGGPTPSATVLGNAVGAGFSNIGGGQIPRGLVGWWLDQQRGLLVYGPVLIIALIGLPHLWRLRGLAGVLLFAPITLAWLLASVWGGFYIAWEISARFLMVGVPLLVAGAAAAFASARGPWRSRVFWPLAAGLVTLSVINTVIVLLKPFIALHESPIRFYEEATTWQLRPYLPAVGTRVFIVPADGQSEWQAPAGQARYLYQSPALDDLSIGWYKLYGQAQLTGPTAATATLTFDIYSSETGIPLMHAEVYPTEAGTVDLALPFFNPYLNKWDFPFYLDIQTTGAMDVRLSPLLLEADPGPTALRVAAWVLGLLALVVWFAPATLFAPAPLRPPL